MMKIALTQNQFAIVDDEDFERFSDFKWCVKLAKDTGTYYAIRTTERVNNKHTTLSLHRLIMNCPRDLQVDHINHDTLDNRKSNLRIVTPSQNGMNKRRLALNTSGNTGVYWRKDNRKWAAFITVQAKRIHLGLFGKRLDAIRARIQAETKYFGEFRFQS